MRTISWPHLSKLIAFAPLASPSQALLKKLSTISEPLSGLEYLVLRPPNEVELTLPSAFYWGPRLRTLHSTRVTFSPEAFVNALFGMTQLQTLSLHFLSLPSRRTYLALPPPQEDRLVLLSLTHLKYRGLSKYLDSLISRLDTPYLGDIDITFVNQPTLNASQLGLFANRTEIQRSPLRADILSSEGTISITITQPMTLTRLGLQISCEQLDWQLSSISQICDQFSSFLICVEDLGIDMSGLSSVPAWAVNSGCDRSAHSAAQKTFVWPANLRQISWALCVELARGMKLYSLPCVIFMYRRSQDSCMGHCGTPWRHLSHSVDFPIIPCR